MVATNFCLKPKGSDSKATCKVRAVFVLELAALSRPCSCVRAQNTVYVHLNRLYSTENIVPYETSR